MAIAQGIQSVKVVLKHEDGSQTISGCDKAATPEGLYSLAAAVAQLLDNDVESVMRVETSVLVQE